MNTSDRSPHRPRAIEGFTLIEMMVVVSVIILLASMGFVAWTKILSNAQIKTAHALVATVATAISNYPTKYWSVTIPDPLSPPGVPPVLKTYKGRLFDLNSGAGTNYMQGDGIIDGTPAVTASATADGPFWKQTILSGYSGFLAMALPPIDHRYVNKKGQVIDPWGNPLHIGFGVGVYGPAGFGVYSLGPDGKINTPDDILSWTSQNE